MIRISSIVGERRLTLAASLTPNTEIVVLPFIIIMRLGFFSVAMATRYPDRQISYTSVPHLFVQMSSLLENYITQTWA